MTLLDGARPQSPGRCRIYVRVVFETGAMPNAGQRLAFRALFDAAPPWVAHLATSHAVLEDDNVFLHHQVSQYSSRVVMVALRLVARIGRIPCALRGGGGGGGGAVGRA